MIFSSVARNAGHQLTALCVVLMLHAALTKRSPCKRVDELVLDFQAVYLFLDSFIGLRLMTTKSVKGSAMQKPSD